MGFIGGGGGARFFAAAAIAAFAKPWFALGEYGGGAETAGMLSGSATVMFVP